MGNAGGFDASTCCACWEVRMIEMIKQTYLYLAEQMKYLGMTTRLAIYDSKAVSAHKYLGRAWDYLDPLFQVLIYAVIFGGGFRSAAPIDGMPFFVWMSLGFSMWYLLNQGFSDTIRSIETQIGLVGKMKFPISILPTIRIFQTFPAVLTITIVAFISMAVTGHFHVTAYWLQAVYYFFSAMILLLGFGIFNAVFNILVPDYDLAVRQVLRLAFFVSGILFQPMAHPVGGFQTIITFIANINPFYYIINGWRETFFNQAWFWQSKHELAIFWIEAAIVYIIGLHLYTKFKDQLVDFI